MTLQLPQKKQDALYAQYLRLQTKVASAAEKEHKVQLRRRRYVVDAFGKWLDTASRAEVVPFLERLAEAATTADRKRIEDFLASLPQEELDPEAGSAKQAPAASGKPPEGAAGEARSA